MREGKGETRPGVGVGWGVWNGSQAREARERIAWGCARWHRVLTCSRVGRERTRPRTLSHVAGVRLRTPAHGWVGPGTLPRLISPSVCGSNVPSVSQGKWAVTQGCAGRCGSADARYFLLPESLPAAAKETDLEKGRR